MVAGPWYSYFTSTFPHLTKWKIFKCKNLHRLSHYFTVFSSKNINSQVFQSILRFNYSIPGHKHFIFHVEKWSPFILQFRVQLPRCFDWKITFSSFWFGKLLLRTLTRFDIIIYWICKSIYLHTRCYRLWCIKYESKWKI